MYIFAGYREWALKTFDELTYEKSIAKNKSELNKLLKKYNKRIKVIFFVGWSDIIDKEIYQKYDCFCYHPSDLPNYRGGSPIQNQIIDGILKTKGTLFKITNRIDGGDIYKKKILNLSGNMDNIFRNLHKNSHELIKLFILDVENKKKIKLKKQPINKKIFKRRKPEMSELTIKEIKSKSGQYLYNKIRSLTDPYPNAYIKTKDGRKLLIKKIELK